MRPLLAISVLLATAMPAVAAPTFNVPEPESMALLAVAGVAAFLARRRKK